MSSLTSPLTSRDAERYALPMSLYMVISNACRVDPFGLHEQSIWKIPIPTL